MTRNGKIARLPENIREELNRRLEDGEQGVRLIEWLNALPEVRALLQQDFEGAGINDTNLSHWKNGGFLDWQARRAARAVIEEWQAGSPMSDGEGSGVEGRGDGAASRDVAEALTERLMVHYAAALEGAIAETDEKASKRVDRLGKSLRDVVRLRRFELINDVERERVQLDRERLELAKSNAQARGANKRPENDEEAERLSHLEKAEMVKQMLEDA